MLHGGLLILKIIGFVLLGILCLLLGLVLLVLLVPIRYRMEGSFRDGLRGTARITWLLHILSVKASYDAEGELVTSIRLFGFPLFRDTADGEEVLEEEAVKAAKAGRAAVRTAEDQGAREEGRRVQEDPLLVSQPGSLDHQEHGAGPEDSVWAESGDDDDPMLQIQEIRPEDERRPAGQARPKESRISRLVNGIKGRVRGFIETIKFHVRALCDKLKRIKDHYEEILAFLKDEKNQKTITLILKQVKAFIRHILPRKASGFAVFGFDDPYTTGQVLAAASLLYAWYGQKIELIPMFEEEILEVELKLSGRIRMGTILWLGFRVFLNKNFRLLLKRWRTKQMKSNEDRGR